MSSRRRIVAAAGGTGGHLFPAAALSHALEARGFEIHLVTDERAEKYGGDFSASEIHIVSAASPRGGGIGSRAQAILALIRGTFSARRLFQRIEPAVVIGFGGYPSVPPVLAASWLHIPTLVHESNAVIGRANRFLAPRADAIAKGFEVLGGLPKSLEPRAHLTGNPVRPMVIEAAKTPFPDFSDGRLRLLVTGGSQGARIFSEIVPAAIALMPVDARRNLILVQQARAEDEERVRGAYAGLGLDAEVRPFFPGLPAKIAQSHLVIARAGGSTLSELAVIGRPAILVPLPHALDQDQAANAKQFTAAGAATVAAQSVFSPQWLATCLLDAQSRMDVLAARAAAAKRLGIPDAAERLADLVQGFLSGRGKSA